MMTAPPEILRHIAELCESSSRSTLVTLLNAEGSTPARIGSRAIVDPGGNVTAGTIGGGALEGLAQQRAAEALRTGDCVAYDVDLQSAGPPVPDPICGGRLRVLIDPASARHDVNRPSAITPNGFAQDEVIRAIWAADGER